MTLVQRNSSLTTLRGALISLKADRLHLALPWMPVRRYLFLEFASYDLNVLIGSQRSEEIINNVDCGTYGSRLAGALVASAPPLIGNYRINSRCE